MVAKSAAGNRTNSKIINGQTNGTAYVFTVIAVDIFGNESQAETVTVTPTDSTPTDTTPPANVAGLSGISGDGTVTLSWTDPADDDLDHIEITWTGGNVTVAKSAAGNRTNSTTITGLTNGTAYVFTVIAVDSSGNDSQGETATVTPTGGTNPPPDTTPIAIANTTDWTNAFIQISADSNGTSSSPKNYILDIQGVVPVPGVGSYGNSISGDYKTVRLTGSGILYLASTGNILRISNNSQTFIIDGPTLRGQSYGASNDTALVYVANGTVELRNGTISGNNNTSNGGGVYIDNGGTFIMSGGTISGNTASTAAVDQMSNGGGGVYSRGTFTMSGGIISDNTAGTGGGVFSGGGPFTMSGGIISGNKASYGGGAYVAGTFTKTGGTLYGDTDNVFGNGNATDNTSTSSNYSGHGVFCRMLSGGYNYYYRNETLADDASGNINTTDALPSESGDILNNWTKR
jgi:hypothetical protein